jgi:hypothetical protein
VKNVISAWVLFLMLSDLWVFEMQHTHAAGKDEFMASFYKINCWPSQSMFLFLCEHDCRGTTSKMDHPQISAGMPHGIRMKTFLAGGLAMAAH